MAYQSEDDRKLWDEAKAVAAELKAAVLPDQHPQIVRLENLMCAAMARGEDRVLRIAGVLLAQHGHPDLFVEIFDAVFTGSTYTGGAPGFLRDQLATLRDGGSDE